MINHQQFLCNHWQRARSRIPYGGEKAAEENQSHYIIVNMLYWPLLVFTHFILDLYLLADIQNNVGNLGNEEKQGSIFMPAAHAYRLSATLWKRALCLDPLPAYIMWNTQKGRMELCPDSGHQSICSLGWLTGTHMCLWRHESRRWGAISVSPRVSGGKR